MEKVEVLDYYDMLAKYGGGPESRKHLLLGNGFSIACDPIFQYGKLYDTAVEAGLSDRAQQVFGFLGTNNFEGVMRLLEDADQVARVYGLIAGDKSALLDDVAIIKKTLIEAVSKSHLPNTGSLADTKKEAALKFMGDYFNVFTTNYDLLGYWVSLSTPDGNPPWGDGFRNDPDEPDATYVVFAERLGNSRGMFYLHGALHLYLHQGELRKHSWKKSGLPLTDLISQGLDAGNYPLFVAEGLATRKLEQIQRTGYLWYCLDKLARVKNLLVVFGHTLGPSDQHITDVLTSNGELPRISIGLFGDLDSPINQEIIATAQKMQQARKKRMRRGDKPLEIVFFGSESAKVWG